VVQENISMRTAWFPAIAVSMVFFAAAGDARASGKVDPYDSYKAGDYEKALQGLVDLQIEHPEDPVLALHIGSVHYKMRNYKDAEKAFSQAAMNGNRQTREKAFYNLGNTAFRQGKLEQAVEWYKKSLELDPNDKDAKFNLEFVRDKIRRMAEQAKKRRQQQKQQQKQGQGQKQKQQPRQQGQQKQGEKKQQQAGQQKKQQQAGQQKKQQQAGQQKKQQQAGAQKKQGQDKQLKPAGKLRKLTKEEAERYLQGLQEDRKKYLKARRAKMPGARYRSEKDW